jgi:hypothetical protein
VNSDGDALEALLRVVRTHIDALGQTLEEALEAIPPERREAVRTRWEEQHAQRIRPAVVLSAHGGHRAWFEEWDPSTGYYWRRQRTYLIDQVGRSETEIESLDDSTDKILSHLEDPRPEGPASFRVQGLVMGYVQSGKTANFSALIAKAADLGYKLFIVLSGIHNTLRQQTQRRLDRELGLTTIGGVGLPEAGRRWISLTTADLYGDFRPGTVSSNVLQGNERVLIVSKKNASVLRRLSQWMSESVPPHVPVLIIDDEADQASINTGGNRAPLPDQVDLAPVDLDGDEGQGIDPDEVSPSRINALIRLLLRSFGRVSFVGYTATPFANVLINHEGIDREAFEDLYPRDFIISLPRPAGWVGTERLFGRDPLPGENDEVQAVDVTEFVPESEIGDLVPDGYDVDLFEPRLCESLKTAFLDYILGIAGRMYRSGPNLPASMLIHTSHRTLVQNKMGELVRGHVTQLRQQWRYDRNSIRPLLRARWETRFRPVIASMDAGRDVSFDGIEEQIDRLFRDPLPVLVLNSTSPDVLDYDTDPSLKAVLIGGNRLSRGLTIEGLLVSYYLREAAYYDTLLQMGRWFGFREEYVDLTRLWTTEDLGEWFHDLAFAEEELRREIERYEREKLTPLEFGPRIRAHPAMQITARNKMGAARPVALNFAKALVQTTTFRLENLDWLEHNLEVTRRFLASLGAARSVREDWPVWSNIDWREVDRFLDEYWAAPSAGMMDVKLIREYIHSQVRHNELLNWTICVCTQSSMVAGAEDLGIASRGPINMISRTRLAKRPYSIGSLVNPATLGGSPGSGDEEIGLTEQQQLEARTEAGDDENSTTLGEALRKRRSQRDGGLLLIYPISRRSQPRRGNQKRIPLFDDPDRHGCTVIGAAMVFPDSSSPAAATWITGSVGTAAEEES